MLRRTKIFVEPKVEFDFEKFGDAASRFEWFRGDENETRTEIDDVLGLDSQVFDLRTAGPPPADDN